MKRIILGSLETDALVIINTTPRGKDFLMKKKGFFLINSSENLSTLYLILLTMSTADQVSKLLE